MKQGNRDNSRLALIWLLWHSTEMMEAHENSRVFACSLGKTNEQRYHIARWNVHCRNRDTARAEIKKLEKQK